MKLFKFLLSIGLINAGILSYGQAVKPAFNEEDLMKYAVTMDSVKGMQENLNTTITEMVQKNTTMKVDRYNALFKVIDDPAKLAETKATPEEIAFVKQVAEKRTTETATITATFQKLAKEYVGLKAFNAIKKSLSTDQALKERVDALTKELDSKGGE
ncbi:MAG: hypothetical protein ABJA70_22990 [Chryseolinea sp.]